MIAPSGSPSNDDKDVQPGAEKDALSTAAPESRRGGGSLPSPNRRNRTLQFASLVLATLVGLVLAECAIRLLNLMPLQRQAAAQPVEARADAADETATNETAASSLIVHSFRGFSPRPLYETEETSQWLNRSNIFGIRSMVTDPRTIDPGDVVVGIFGGSVARGIAIRGRETIRQAILDVHPDLQDSLRIVNFAISGYKQPQQLYFLSELFLLGVPIDIVVNIDGFNEIAIGGTDASRGNHPLYPERNRWLTTLRIAGGSLSARQIELTAEIMRLRRRIADNRSTLENLPVLRRSALAQTVWGTSVLARERKAIALEENLRVESEAENDQTVFTLPDPCLNQEEGCRQLIADLWRSSSEQMRVLAEYSGASYLHVLQPNQYVDGSKPINAEELKTAWAPQRPWSRFAASGYPLLREVGRELVANGVGFHDLSLAFKDHLETLYIDPCCHYNQQGYEILAREISDLISSEITIGRTNTKRDPGLHPRTVDNVGSMPVRTAND